jgi:hypothetical protein
VKELLSFFFLSIAAVYQRHSENGIAYYVAALITSLLAIGSKEWAATLPAMLLLYDYVFISQGSFKRVSQRWQAYILLFLPWVLAIYILTLYKGATSAGFSITGQKGITPLTYLLTSFNVLWTYIRLMILPINQNIDYDYPLATSLFALPTLLSFLGHIIIVVGAFGLQKERLALAPSALLFYNHFSDQASCRSWPIFEHRMTCRPWGFLWCSLLDECFEWLARKTENIPSESMRSAGKGMKKNC